MRKHLLFKKQRKNLKI